MDLLKGNRTKIAGWLSAVAGVTVMLGVEIDPVAAMEWIEEFNRLIGAGFVLLGGAVHWFRNLANK